MLRVIFILILSLYSCVSYYPEYSKISYQTQNYNLLPLTVKVNDVVVDTIKYVDYNSCYYANEWVLVEAYNTYKVELSNFTYSKIFYVRVGINDCNLITVN